MKIGFYQNNPEFGEKKKNLEQAMKELVAVDAGLVVMPELFNTGYQFVSKTEVANLAEEIPGGDTCSALLNIAAERNMFLVFGIAEKENGKFYNSAAVVGPDGYIGKYRKSHLFAEEKLFFTPGDTGFRVFDIGAAHIGVMICFDWWFPESARSLALMGADIICHPANLVLKDCQRAMEIRSLENGVYSITANRVGRELRGGKPALEFTGGSQIVSPSGEALTKAGKCETGIFIADIDATTARDKSIATGNDRFIDRRPELYRSLTDTAAKRTKIH